MSGWHYSYYVQWLGLGVPLAIAVLSNRFSRQNFISGERRKGNVDRLNDQLKFFYGPLLACVTCSKSAYDSMCAVHSPDGSKETFIRLKNTDPKSEQAVAYRLWMREVFMPLNERAAKLIAEHADLLEGDSFEPLLLQLVAHVGALRVMIKQWDQGNLSTVSTSIGYPDAIHSWANRAFGMLKRKQARYLGIVVPTSKL
eukprot:g1135.t1